MVILNCQGAARPWRSASSAGSARRQMEAAGSVEETLFDLERSESEYQQRKRVLRKQATGGRALLVAALLLFSACNWKADGPARLKSLYPQEDLTSNAEPEDIIVPLDRPDTPYEPGTDIQLNNLWGYYVVKMSLPATMDLFPGIGEPYPLLLTNLFVAFWSDDGLDWSYCQQFANLDAGGLGETEMLPETNAALGQVPIYLETAEGIGIEQQTLAWTWGIQGMDDPVKDPLPTSGDDPLVWDQDDDGNPGVTIKVLQPAGFRYMVRRAVWHLEPAAITEDGDRLEGKVKFQVHEGAVGYDGPSSLKTIIPVVSDPSGGSYTMVRTNEYYSCEQLLAEYPGIF